VGAPGGCFDGEIGFGGHLVGDGCRRSWGGKGAISVIGIAYPAEFSQMVRLGLEGKVAEANQLHYGLLPKIGLAFKEGNPIGIKAILAAKGLCEPYVRLPLVEASAELKKEVAANVQF